MLRESSCRFQAPRALGRTALFQLSPSCRGMQHYFAQLPLEYTYDWHCSSSALLGEAAIWSSHYHSINYSRFCCTLQKALGQCHRKNLTCWASPEETTLNGLAYGRDEAGPQILGSWAQGKREV